MLELESQLRRDHALLDAALSTLLDIARPSQDAVADLRALFMAHVESEAVILRAALTRATPPPPPFVAFLIAQVTAAHLAQERVLDVLANTRPSSPAWRHEAQRLANLMREHNDHEDVCVLPALRDQLPAELLGRLAARYDAIRTRALGLVA